MKIFKTNIMVCILTKFICLFYVPAFSYTQQKDTLSASFYINANCVKEGKEIKFKNKSKGATFYKWDFGDNTYSTEKNPVHTFTDFGYYCVILIASNQNNSDTICETIFVNPECFNCKTKFTIPDNFVLSDSVTIWDKNTFNDSIITIQGDVIIPANKTLLITGINVQFSPKGRIIVERGGTLNVNSSKLSSIVNSTMWQGIEVWGDRSRPSTHTVQGSVLIRSSTIENAHIGILLGKRKTLPCNTLSEANPFEFAYGGGVVSSSGTTYKNNGIGIKFTPKTNVEGYANKIQYSTFICTGISDPHYNSSNSNPYPNSHHPWTGHANPNQRTDIGIESSHIRGIGIYNSNFENLEYGIFTIDNQRTTVLNCTFKSHRQGIHVENILPTMWNSYDITGCTFDFIPGNTAGTLGINDGTAIYIAGGRGDRIYDGNVFRNTYLPNINPTYGIKLNNTSSFDIKNNTFNSLNTGITIQNSAIFGGGYVRAYTGSGAFNWQGNVFNACGTGVTTKNDNSALCLRCNDHNNGTGFNTNWDNPAGSILADQGVANSGNAPNQLQQSRYGAGNWFDPVNLRKIISPSSYNYYHHSFPIQYVPDTIGSPNIGLSDISIGFIYSKSLSCLFPTFINPNVNLPSSLNNPVFQRIDSLNNVMLSLQSQYNTLLNNADKGQTQQLLNAINATPPSGQLKNMLIANSPLSDTVLITLNNQNPLSHGNYKNVMDENLPVTRNVVPSFNCRVETLPSGIKNQLKAKQANNPGKITIGNLETLLGQAKISSQLYFNEIISLLLDTLNNREADAITLFENQATPAANMVLTATYINDSNYSSALSKLALLPDDNSQIGEWKTYAVFLLNHFLQGKTIDEFDSIQVDYIRNIAYQCPEGTATVNAKAILMYLYREEVPTCPENGLRTMRIENSPVNQSVSSYLGENYPDPFSRNTMIPYYLPEGSKGELIIKDVAGRIILTLSLQEGDHEIEINSKDWADGIYFYGMNINGENIENKKMIKSK